MASSSAGQIARDKQKNVKTTASAGQVTITSFAASAPRESFGSARDSAEVLIERKQFHVGDILSWLFLAPWWLSTIYAMLLTLVILAALYLWGGPRQDDTFAYHVDLAVYVFIYSTWFTVFLPQLLVTLNFKLLLHTGGIIFKVRHGASFFCLRRLGLGLDDFVNWSIFLVSSAVP
ncbi:hypothetical protein BaRGS_00017062 [Batillaria attramentaria]|uniref:Uncharacterized protein n=1 Tax=Batillaria attramentaria TaxID=370345 RepID=A0ABD0KWK7_9CAEN